MSSSAVVVIDTIRTVAFGGISGTYALVGTPFTFPCRLICFTNNTNGDVFFSDDGVNDKLFLPAQSFKLFDVTSNRYGNIAGLVFPIHAQFYVKQSTAPSSGSVYIECLG